MSTFVQQLPNTGKQIRLSRILNTQDNRAAVVAFDRGMHVGVIPGVESPGQMLESLVDAGADAFLVGPGVAQAFSSIFCGRGALDAGASGMFIGRNVFQTPTPTATMRALSSLIHQDLTVEEALTLMKA